MRKPIGLSIDSELLEEVDHRRGYMNRSSYIIGILQNSMPNSAGSNETE
jgi:metal-responsive CopG/Arc/MetJ family transcriptional regulator